MIRFSLAGSILGVMLLDAACMYSLHVALEAPTARRPRFLLVGNDASDSWQRTIEGAQAAADELNVELEVELPAHGDVVDQQNSMLRSVNFANYEGIAISPVDPKSQAELINDLAGRTKLVTIDRDECNCRRLCHIGFGQSGAGALAARLVRDQLSHSGKVALFAITFSEDDRNENVSERLAGFKEMWSQQEPDNAMRCRFIEVTTDSNFSATLADPELAFIVAFDSKSAKFALDALASQSKMRRVPFIAFDPDGAIFDAIGDGRVCCAIFHDPYRSGFEAIQRLNAYCGASKDGLPVPGFGSVLLVSEEVWKENLTDIRRRFERKSGAAQFTAAQSFTLDYAVHRRNSPAAIAP